MNLIDLGFYFYSIQITSYCMGLEDGVRSYNAVTAKSPQSAVMNGRLRVGVDGDMTSEAGEFVMFIYDIFAEPGEFFRDRDILYLI
jgi:hypothetical protein